MSYQLSHSGFSLHLGRVRPLELPTGTMRACLFLQVDASSPGLLWDVSKRGTKYTSANFYSSSYFNFLYVLRNSEQYVRNGLEPEKNNELKLVRQFHSRNARDKQIVESRFKGLVVVAL